jgi:hypothetical protein
MIKHCLPYVLVATIATGCAGVADEGELDADAYDPGEPIAVASTDTAADADPSLSEAAAGRTACLNADGPGGKDTYALIESVLGRGALETPDADHHPPLRHVREEIDPVIGPHFVFLAHRDIDTDRQTNFDRSRMEIKVSPSSGPQDPLKGRKGDTFSYSWRFRMNPQMTFSNRFTHMFQMKSAGGDDGAPLITITGRKASGGDKLQVIHTGPPSRGVLGETSLAGLKGVWLDVSVRATFSDNGAFAMTIKRPDGKSVIAIDVKNVDMWRDGDHIRPKGGIYRGKSNQLRPDEEDVRFANFAITPSATPTSDCHAR